MKKHITFSLITVAMLGIAPYAFAEQDANDKTTAKEVKQGSGDDADKRDEATEKAKAALDTLDAHIDALEAHIDKNWEKMSQAAREESRSTLKALRSQRVKVAEWYGGMKNSSAEAWEHMKQGFSDAYKSLQSAWEKAEAAFEEDKK